jgi:segregation and condensation protein B
VTTETSRAIEAILMVAQEPVEPHLLAQLLEVSPTVVEETCANLASAYQHDQRGFELVRVAGGYRFQSAADLTAYVERFALEGQSARLSAAALETLAIVAYKQPLSRAQVAAIRGVNVDGVMRTLQQRGYIEEVGRDPGPGQATLFGTSREFLERMGLDRIEDLPPIADLFPSAEVMEALEITLRAEAHPAPPAGEPQGAPPPDAEPNTMSEETVDGDDDLPEPQPPVWALDPPGSAPPSTS